MRISIGVIIGIILIVIWWRHDHPTNVVPAKQGSLITIENRAA